MKKHSVEYFLNMAQRNDWRLPSSVPWKTVRAVVLLRDKYECQCQNHRQRVKLPKLHVHHIHYPEWDLKDLATLCDECHAKQPKQTFDKELETLPMKEWERVIGLVGYSRKRRIKEKLGPVQSEDRKILSEID